MDGDKARFLFGEVPVGLDPDDPDDRAALLALDDGEELSEFRSAVREVVAAQIADDDPPEVWATAQRLLELGWEREEVLNQLCLVFAQATHRALGDRGIPFERAGYTEMLARLPLPRAVDVATAVVAAVREAQPVPIDDVNRLALERLGLAGDDLTEVLAHKVIDELLDDPDGPLALLSGDLTVHVEDFCSGIVLTHRLTEEEAEAGVIPVEFDLAGFARRDELRLAGGDPLA